MSTVRVAGSGNGKVAWANLLLSTGALLGVFWVGVDVGRQRGKLDQVPTRDETRLIVIAEIEPLEEQVRALSMRISLLEQEVKKLHEQ